MQNDIGILLDKMKIPLKRAFRAHNSPFCIRGAVMGFLNPLNGKQYKMKEHREQSLIPFFLQTSLSLSYLLHNLMSKKNYLERPYCVKTETRSKKKKEI